MSHLQRFQDAYGDDWMEIAPNIGLFTMEDRGCGHAPGGGCPLVNQTRADIDEEFGPLKDLEPVHVREVWS